MPASVPAVYPLPLRAGCVLNLDMQDRGSRILDHSGVGSHGLSYGSIPVAAPYGLARKLDGVDDYLSLGSNPKVAITGNAPRTIMCWANLASSTKTNTLFSYGFMDTGRMVQFATMSFTGRLAVYMSGNDHISNSVVPLNSWHLAAVVIFGTTSLLYLDGRLVSSRTNHTLIDTASSDVLIGVRFDGGVNTSFSGQIGIVQVYDYALSAAEIEAACRENGWRYGA